MACANPQCLAGCCHSRRGTNSLPVMENPARNGGHATQPAIKKQRRKTTHAPGGDRPIWSIANRPSDAVFEVTASIDIGRLLPAFPVTPPCIRVRTRRFRDLSQGPEVRVTFRRWRLRRSQVSFGLHPIRPWQAQPKLIGWRMAIHEIRVLLLTITVRAFVRCRTTMPSADFCCAINCLTAVSVVTPRHATDLPR
jgi:hypothetical protein